MVIIQGASPAARVYLSRERGYDHTLKVPGKWGIVDPTLKYVSSHAIESHVLKKSIQIDLINMASVRESNTLRVEVRSLQNMPSRISDWPIGWPSFTQKDSDPRDTYQLDLKKKIINIYGAENLRTSWNKTCKALSAVTSRLSSKGNTSVPVFTYEDLTDGSNLEQISDAGCCIIRSVIPRIEAEQHFKDLETFIAENKDVVTGWPVESVAIYHLYSSPTQLKIKTNPRHLHVQRLLNSLWKDSSCPVNEQQAQNEPVLYPDGLRIRLPGQEFFGLGPHVDGGSLCRWADEEYLKTYDAVLSGKPEDYDPYETEHRKNANMAMFPGGAQCSVFRAFQGWTALTPCKPGEGGLMLVPNVKIVTAYMILRPFFKMPEDGSWEDSEKWELDASAWFPGTYRWDSQLLSPTSHPHLHLEETLMSCPEMKPGDTIWWHADVCPPFPLLPMTICAKSFSSYAMQLKQSIMEMPQQVWSTFLRHHRRLRMSRTSANIGKTLLLVYRRRTTSFSMDLEAN